MDMTRSPEPERKIIKVDPETHKRLIKYGRYKDNMSRLINRLFDWVDKMYRLQKNK